ncbi:MAG: hypothetical protein WDA15_03565 [Trueperaceae bacterium]
MMGITWVDAVLVLIVAVATAFGAQRRLVGLVVGVSAVLLLKPLLVVGSRSPLLAIAAAVLGGVLLAVLSQRLASPGLRQRWPSMVAGGFGGLVLGLAMLVAFVTAMPIERSVTDQRAIYYPPVNAPFGMSSTLQRSPLVTMGRSIVLYTLLEPPESELEQSVLRGLRNWFVEGDPWN